MARKLRAAVVGLGWAGSVHARTLDALDGVDLVALADPDPRRRAQFPGYRTVPHLRDLLVLDLDYCIVAAPTAAHEGLALQLAAVGVPALIEKPLASTSAAARRIEDAFRTTGVLAAVGHTERHTAPVAELARLLHSGEFGALWHIDARRQGPYSGRIRDVGVTLDLAVHDLDLGAWLARAPIESVTADTVRIAGPHEDLVTATARLGGVLLSVHADWISPRKARTVQVRTEAGLLTADAVAGTLTLHANSAPADETGAFRGVGSGPAVALPVAERTAPFTVQHELLRDALLGHDVGGLVTLADGAEAVAAAEAVLAAAATGRSTPVAARRLAAA
ncbi:gfo/Idh/MocA family oxidoreductase [Kitasatospora xanthocidica]|uniref:Gfo/Idh/MocA family oxidoreductase n=1 Tax=Kitasatospora xanthocidica TaxID=83382 RepID=A0A373A1Q4_9ACTN|nr:Gfo/Idh/MocA family oxidoreductase [Kitasatospora xanthocidica]RGD61991.1 gfo/Idh/MocA family oxidoreductase [Kitasatospora xanthocidica]